MTVPNDETELFVKTAVVEVALFVTLLLLNNGL